MMLKQGLKATKHKLGDPRPPSRKRMIKIKVILLALMLTMVSLFAAEGYAEVEKQDQEAFSKEMAVEIEKQVKDASKYVKYLYKTIDYQPIWVDKDYLSYHTEMLLSELKNDFKKGLHKDLVAQYKAFIAR